MILHACASLACVLWDVPQMGVQPLIYRVSDSDTCTRSSSLIDSAGYATGRLCHVRCARPSEAWMEATPLAHRLHVYCTVRLSLYEKIYLVRVSVSEPVTRR